MAIKPTININVTHTPGPTPMFPVPPKIIKYIKGTDLPVELVYIGTETIKGRPSQVAVVWFDWEPTPEMITALFLQFRTKDEAQMNPMISVRMNQAAIRYDNLTDGPTGSELGKVLYETP